MDITLATNVQVKSYTVTVKHAPTIGGSPILPIFMKGYAELIEQGHALSFMMGTNKSKAMYAEVNGHIAGYIVYDIQEDILKTAYIVSGEILAPYRRQGIYQVLHRYLEESVKKLGSKRVNSMVNINNTSMIELNKIIGKNPTFLKMEKFL